MSNDDGLLGPTITVLGGRALSTVDETEIRTAADRMNSAADRLNRASLLARDAATAMDRSARANQIQLVGAKVWTAAERLLNPAAARAQDQANEQTRTIIRVAKNTASGARATANSLQTTAKECQQLNVRLLKAAGLYQEAENKVSQFLHNTKSGLQIMQRGIATYYGFFYANTAGGILGLPPLLAYLAKSHQTDSNTPVPPIKEPLTFLEQLSPLYAFPNPLNFLYNSLSRSFDLLVTKAPCIDGFINGFGLGIAAHHPKVASDVSITGAAGVLSLYAGSYIPPTKIETEQYYTGSTPAFDEFTVATPTWANSGPKSLDEALFRVDQLHPHTSTIPGRTASNMPEGTIGIDKVTHQDGSISYNVYIPGTEGFEPGNHPHDGITDLKLMAGQWSDIQIAVTNALKSAGAKPGDGVVLVGHSLGGIAAAALASSSTFNQKYRVKGVVTAGSPVATFDIPRGIPCLHLEHESDIVAKTDGAGWQSNPQTPDRVTVVGNLAASGTQADWAAGASVAGSHEIETYRRTLNAAKESGNLQAADIIDRIEKEMTGVTTTTTFWTSLRVPDVNVKSKTKDEDVAK